MRRLLSPDFVTEGNSVILFGKTGRGKTRSAVARNYPVLSASVRSLA